MGKIVGYVGSMVHVRPAYYQGNVPVWRRCCACKRLMHPGDETHQPLGKPEPNLWPTTDGICCECRPAYC